MFKFHMHFFERVKFTKNRGMTGDGNMLDYDLCEYNFESMLEFYFKPALS